MREDQTRWTCTDVQHVVQSKALPPPPQFYLPVLPPTTWARLNHQRCRPRITVSSLIRREALELHMRTSQRLSYNSHDPIAFQCQEAQSQQAQTHAEFADTNILCTTRSWSWTWESLMRQSAGAPNMKPKTRGHEATLRQAAVGAVSIQGEGRYSWSLAGALAPFQVFCDLSSMTCGGNCHAGDSCYAAQPPGLEDIDDLLILLLTPDSSLLPAVIFHVVSG